MSPPLIRRIQDEHRLDLAEVESAVMIELSKERGRSSRALAWSLRISDGARLISYEYDVLYQ